MEWMMTLVSALVTVLLTEPLAVVTVTMFALVAVGLSGWRWGPELC